MKTTATIFFIISIFLVVSVSGAEELEKYEKKDVSNILSLEDSISITYSFSTPLVTFEEESVLLFIDGLENRFIPGEPILPMRVTNILLPNDKEVSGIVITYGKEKIIANGNPVLADLPVQFGKDKGSDIVFEKKEVSENFSVQEFSGERVLNYLLFPVIFDEETKDFHFFEEIELQILFEDSSPNMADHREKTEKEKDFLLSLIDNPSSLGEERPQIMRTFSENVEPLEEQYGYVIITSQELANYEGEYNFQALLNQKAQRVAEPIEGTIVTVESILANSIYNCDGPYGDGCAISAFNDSTARIRNFIRYAYENWGTTYVLLGGDVSIIPVRSFYINLYRSDVPATNIPSDMYYANLDGSMNANLDSYWGWDGDSTDFLSDIYVGRAPVDNSTQLSNFIRKTMLYESLAIARNNYTKNVLNVYDSSISTLSIPTTYLNQYLYNVTIKSSPSLGWIPTYLNTTPTINLPAIINHAGHGSTTYLSGYGYATAPVLNEYPNFFYSQGCLVGGFDNSDSFAEILTYSTNASFAVLMNSRYGWYVPGLSSSGPGNIFMNEFWRQVLFNDVKHLAPANQLSKYSQLYGWGDYSRWLYWTQNLLGDPELSIYFYPSQVSAKATFRSPIQSAYYNSNFVLVNLTCTNCTASWWGNGSSNYSSPINFSFPNGENILYGYANDSYGNLDTTLVNFTIDLEAPRIGEENISGEFKRDTAVYFDINFTDNYGVSKEILETNVTGTLLNYTYVVSNSTETEAIIINLSSEEDSFSYRFYISDHAENVNVSEWSTIQIVNSPPTFNSIFEEQSVFILSNTTLYFEELFSDVDSDTLSFEITESTNVSYLLGEESLVFWATNSSVDSGFITLTANDSQNTTSQRINISFVRPSFVPLGSDNFDGETTNLSALSSFVMIPLTIQKATYGKIVFGAANLTCQNITFGTHINFSSNKVFLNSSALPGLNSSATITLNLSNFNSNYASIYKDGAICSSCSIVSFNTTSKEIVFNVSGFSEYEVRAQTCSDGIKNQDETGVDCGGSCSACSVVTSIASPSGGGGGGTVKRISSNIQQIILPLENISRGIYFLAEINKTYLLDLDSDVNLSFTNITENYTILKINNFTLQIISLGEQTNLNIAENVSISYQNYSAGKANIFLQKNSAIVVEDKTWDFVGQYSPFATGVYSFFSNNPLILVLLFLVVLLFLISRKPANKKH